MAINWNGEKRNFFRLALQNAYTDYDLLEIFVSEKLDAKLPEIAEEAELPKVTFKLLKWVSSDRGPGLDELLKIFCEANPRIKDSVLAELKRQPLIPHSANLSEENWESLFAMLGSDDSAYVQIAFLQAFKAVYERSFREMRPDYPPMNNLDDIQDLLTKYDNPTLAARFVELVIVELRRSSEDDNRDLTALEQWRDRITQQFNVPPPAPVTAQKKACHAYLLAALEEHGSDVNVYPELRITGLEKPIGFGANPTTCPVEKVAEQISKWILQAEEVLEANTCDEEEVTLEVFLPCQHLEEDIATTWSVKDKRGGEIALGTYRRLLVRSSDRIRDRQIQRTLKRRWTKLEEYIRENNAFNRFHLQKDCPTERGTLRALLKDEEALGLKFVAQLPTDLDQRTDLLYEIIDAAIPIALWSSKETEPNANTLITEFDELLNSCHLLTNFDDLARQWRLRRLNSSSAKYIRLLCDRPDRLPRLPDLQNREDEDAIVAL